jgi:hypothetical protein
LFDINGKPYYFQREGFYQYQATDGGEVDPSPDPTPSSLSATEDFPGPPISSPQTGVARNENLYAYLQALTGGAVGGMNNIPGFGGNFYLKYPGAEDSTGALVSDRDEILTEMFDLIRSGVNTYNTAPNILPHYTYTPFKADMAPPGNPYNGPPDPAETVPISIPSNHTHGLGRTYNFDEVSLVFMAQAMDLNDGYPAIASTPPYPPQPAGSLDPYNPNRMSIGPGLPWAVAIGTNSLFTVPPYQKSPPIRKAPAGTSPSLGTDDYVPMGSARAGGYSNFPVLGPYTGKFIKQLHTLTAQYGNRSPLNLFFTSYQILTDPPEPFPGNTNPSDGPIGYIGQQAGGIGETEGQLIPNEEYSYQSAPNVTPELQGAFMDAGGQIPGDWTLGMGPTPDGAFLQKPDEGYQALGSGSNDRSYYTTDLGDADLTEINVSYSPNREIPSAVAFGGLPSRAMQGIPWCTLLFCPNPAANDNGETDESHIHPGFGTSGAGSLGTTNDPDYFNPPYTLPPDHLFLDLFWMPVVDPYAISEPFSTAGKVNLNYEIVPFGSYIHRSTALHAVMKATQLLAVPTKYNNDSFIPPTATTPPDYTNFAGTVPCFKSIAFWYEDATWDGGTQYDFACRYGINLTATIDDAPSAFQQRFTVLKDIFRSAAEICNIFLVPQTINGLKYSPDATPVPTDASYNSMQAWWKNFQLTGDNGREDPYNQLYPRLTTKSNDFQVHMRVQVVSQVPSDRGAGNFDSAAGDSVVGEYRGSAIVERYLDPNQTGIPDFATTFPSDPTSTVDNFVHYRVVSTQAFSP